MELMEYMKGYTHVCTPTYYTNIVISSSVISYILLYPCVEHFVCIDCYIYVHYMLILHL